MKYEDAKALAERLEKRTIRQLPQDWRKGLRCPDDSCGVDADRPKCFLDMGGYCPRHNPENYDPSPYKTMPDKDCVKAAEIIKKLLTEPGAERYRVLARVKND